MMAQGWSTGRAGALIAAMAVATSGCAIRLSQRSPWDIQQIQTLSDQLEQFRTLAQLKADEAERLREGKALLAQRLASEIDAQDIRVGFDERGLVVRVLDHVLFDSGKAVLRQEAYAVLDKVVRILNEELISQPVGIEGHTDNEPITHSGWKDNWELSLARARAVLTYLVKERGVDPSRTSAAGFGEYRPIASNETPEGRQMNRRVELVVSPQAAVRAQAGASDESPRAGTASK
jgi:chemotaxis protein MotB